MKSNFVTSRVASTAILTISALSCLSIFGFNQSALAQDRECARFSINKNGRGPSFSVCLTNSTGVPNGFNDKISSINIPKGKRCILYTDGEFNGLRKEFRGPVRFNLGPQLDNKVSSIQCTVQ